MLASGLDRPGPAGNRPLARDILRKGGAWLSEHPPGTPARAHHFPDRNRLISGLSRATLIVEARERSGTLWTARHAAPPVYLTFSPADADECEYSNPERLLRLIFSKNGPFYVGPGETGRLTYRVRVR